MQVPVLVSIRHMKQSMADDRQNDAAISSQGSASRAKLCVNEADSSVAGDVHPLGQAVGAANGCRSTAEARRLQVIQKRRGKV